MQEKTIIVSPVFNSNVAMDEVREGDLLIVAKRPDWEIYMIVILDGYYQKDCIVPVNQVKGYD